MAALDFPVPFFIYCCINNLGYALRQAKGDTY